MAYAISDIVRDSRGVPVSDALVYVYSPQGGLASLYDDLGAPIENPLASNDNGLFEGYATEEGYHKLSIHYGGRERYIQETLLGTEPIARAEGAASVLAAVNGGYWEDSLTPPTDAAEGQDFYASFDGRAILARNVGGVGIPRWELATQAQVDSNYKLTGGYTNFDIFEEVETTRRARLLHRPVASGVHVGTLVAGWGVEHRVSGSGSNGPSNADVGADESSIKTTDTIGEMDVLYLYGKQRGLTSDIAGVLCQIDRKGGTGFSAQWEGTTREVDPVTGVATREIRCQYGVLDNVSGESFGYLASAQLGVTKRAIYIRSDGGLFENFISAFSGDNAFPTFNISGDGTLTLRKGGLNDLPGTLALFSQHFAKSGGAGDGGGNTIGVSHLIQHYTPGADWTTTETLWRQSVDGVAEVDSYFGFRNRADSKSAFIVGFGTAGPSFEVRRDGGVKLTPLAADPPAPEPGAIWFNSTDNQLKLRKNATTVVLG